MGCKKGWYIDGFEVRFEDIEFIEDLSGLNGLKFHCRNKANPDQKGWTLVHSGHWKPKIVHANMFVIGAKTKFGGRIGNDDIGMDGLKVKYDLCAVSFCSHDRGQLFLMSSAFDR